MAAVSGAIPAAFANSSLPWQTSHRFAMSRRSAGTGWRGFGVGTYAASFFTACGEPWHEAQVGPETFVSSRSHFEWIEPANASVASAWQFAQARNARGAVTVSFLSPSPQVPFASRSTVACCCGESAGSVPPIACSGV